MIRRPLTLHDFEPINIIRDWQPRGVIHVGANDGEEFAYYKKMGIKNLCGFEPLKAAFERFDNAHPDVIKFMLGWSDENAQVAINVTQNDKASSVLKTVEVEDWQTHPVFKDWNMGQWPIVRRDAITLVCYDDWFASNKAYQAHDYNLLNMDVQGMELRALRGMGDQLRNFDALIIECSKEPVYQGESSANEVIDYLKAYDFEQLTPTKLHGDILFVKRSELNG